jgi:hypothetical protein
MSPEEFVSQVREDVIEDNVSTYKTTFESADPVTVTDPYWQRALALYRSLGDADRKIILEMMRQSAVDTASSMFALLDGVSALREPREELVVKTASDNRKINGTLQDLFLEADEASRTQ